ncbi:MAG: SWIM zinc finger family protein [Bacteroidia bacterium]|nr:SWIM zinc finger family protein [Bacteroidia bacterium]
MNISISQFLQTAGPAILDRGRDYFKNGHVISFEEIQPGEYEAVVEGTEDYLVNLTVINGSLEDCSCTCPYDFGSVCKHIVAAVMYLQKEEPGFQEPIKEKKSVKRPKAKKKTISEQVDEMLGSISHDDLKEFVKKQCISDPAFRRSFISGFLYKTSEESPEMYREQVKGILRSAKGKDNFISWSRVGMVGKAVNTMLEIANRHVSDGNFMSAIGICFPVAEEMVKALDYADDSDGDIGENTNLAFDILAQVSESDLSEEVRLHLFEQVLKDYKKEIFSGWDWQVNLLEIAVQLAKTEIEAKKVMSLLSTHSHYEYESEQMTKLEYELIRKMSGEAEAEKFIEQNLDNPDLRRNALEKAIRTGDFEKAETLARDGISQDSEDKPGLAKEWYDWLLRIAMKKDDRGKIIEYARYLFVDGFRHDQDYYAILKKHTDKSEWQNFVEGIISEIRKKSHWSEIDVIAKIYIEEQWWERLLELVSGTKHLPYIQHYEKYLSDLYPAELAELYEKGIVDYLKRMTGRNHYQEACRYMRRIIKLGARKRVNELILFLRREYPQRRALLDELNKI